MIGNKIKNLRQEILTLGFGLDPPEARKTVDKWRIEERLAKGNITIDELNIGTNNGVIGENATIVNEKSSDKVQQAIEMAQAGLSEEMIKKLLNI